jgi:hypothetical protein
MVVRVASASLPTSWFTGVKLTYDNLCILKVYSLPGVVETVIPALRRLKQEDCKFEASLGCIVRLYLKQTNKKYVI